jgi:hypothetical protein
VSTIAAWNTCPFLPRTAALAKSGYNWRSGGPTVQPPTRRGFGTLVIEQIAGQLKRELLFD